MFYLYLDNFRGFQDALMPIRDVNFLVGENTSGKTSMMGILANVFDQNSKYSSKFDGADVFPKEFEDLVSVSSKKRDFFSYGIVVRDEKSDRISAELRTFENKDGYPSMVKYSSLNNEQCTHFQFGEAPAFKIQALKRSNSIEEFISKDFSKLKNQRFVSVGYTAFKSKDYFLPSGVELMVAQSLAQSMVKKKNGSTGAESISLAMFDPLKSTGVAYFDPIRSTPRKTYDEFDLKYSKTGAHTPYLIKTMLRKSKEAKKFKSFIKEVGSNTGLFDSIRIKQFSEASHSPFELEVELNGKFLRIGNVGYGVSQALPILVEAFRRPKYSRFIIQQPEVHLHPRGQAAFGDIVFKMAVEDKKEFIVETHSDFLIDRFRQKILEFKNESGSVDSQILFFERTAKGNRVTPIQVNRDGGLSENQPKSYRDFFVREQLKNLGI